MSIIEKLGVTDGIRNNRRLVEYAPEMLEALIGIIDEYAWGEDSIVWDNAYIAIQKATGKTWEEIKELL